MVKISDLFEVQRGSCAGIPNYEVGTTPLVSATTYQNGVVGFVCAKDEEIFPGNSISVAINGDGSIMFSAIQRTEFYATSDCEVLVPKQGCDALIHNKLSKLIAIAALLRASRWRFSFGRKAGGRLADLELDEKLIERIASQVKVEVPEPVALAPSVLHQVVAKLRDLYGDNPTIGDVFELKQGTEISPSELQEEGRVPVVSASVKETNAVVGYLDEAEALLPGRSLTVSKHVGGVRLQLAECAITSNAIGLVPYKSDWSDAELVVMAALIDRQSWRISYGRIYSERRLAPLRMLDGLVARQAA